MSYCERCLFSSTYRDMGASCRTCSLICDLGESIKFRAINEGKNTCRYALFFCDIVDSLNRHVGLPDRDIIYSYSYQWSRESKFNGCNCDLHVSVDKG